MHLEIVSSLDMRERIQDEKEEKERVERYENEVNERRLKVVTENNVKWKILFDYRTAMLLYGKIDEI